MKELARWLKNLHVADVQQLEKCDDEVISNLERCVTAAGNEECKTVKMCQEGIQSVRSVLERPCNASPAARKRAERFLRELARLIQNDELQAA